MPQRRKQTIAACLLVLVLLFATVTTPRRAHADIIGDFSGCAGGALLSIGISAALSYFGLTVPTADISQIIKEKVEDCFAWSIANAALEQITFEITDSVNTGFDGNPAYVTDLNRELSNTVDDAFVDFTQSGWIPSVSPALRDDLVFSLLVDYNERTDFGKRISSTLDEEINDIDEFVNPNPSDLGNFNRNGSWSTWYKLTQEKQNNRWGAFLLTQEESRSQIQNRLSEKETEIEIGRGFMNKTECEPSDDPQQGEDCVTVTPAVVIQESLQQTYGANLARIVEIDELNEALSTLFTGLLNEILSDDGGGLAGAGEFIAENSDFSEEFGDKLDGVEVLPIGGCPVAAGATLSPEDEAATVDLYNYLNSQRTGQMVFGGGDQPAYTATVVDGARYDYNGSSIADAVGQLCVAHGATCPGTGTLSEGDKQGILKLDSWSDVGRRNLLALREDSQGRGFWVDYYDSAAGGIGQFGTFPTIEAAAETFCSIAEGGGEAG